MFPRKTTGRSSNLPAKTCREIAIFKFWILGSSLVLVSGFTHTWSMATHTPACQDVRCNKVLEARSWCTGLLQNPVAKIGFQGRRERSTRASRRRQGRREQVKESRSLGPYFVQRVGCTDLEVLISKAHVLAIALFLW
mmetsp:Transcript_68028/g.160131  ORF Transcript_68028/g.160131 Transcript_68028/m.160131 type:complete len:138 (+) Transcript_68028:66-479(+)